jgi:hypothetical protein
MTNKVIRDDVKITYYEVVPEDKQMAEFYVDGTTNTDVATLEYHGRVLHIARNGEMYLSIPAEDWDGYDKEYNETIIRYADDLEALDIETDNDLVELTHLWCVEREYQIYHDNPWWEIYNEDNFPDGIVCDEGDFYAAIDMAIKLIKDDKEWNE